MKTKQNLTKRIMSFVLSFAMILIMLPNMKIEVDASEELTIKVLDFALTHNSDGSLTISNVTVPDDKVLVFAVITQTFINSMPGGSKEQAFGKLKESFDARIGAPADGKTGISHSFDAQVCTANVPFTLSTDIKDRMSAGTLIAICDPIDADDYYSIYEMGMIGSVAEGETAGNQLGKTANTVTVSSGVITGTTVTTKDAYVNNKVSITADTAPSGKVFDHWTSTPTVTFEDANSATTTFTMIDEEVTITATYSSTTSSEEISVNIAKDLIENGTYTFTQATANTQADAKTEIARQINALAGMSATGITISEDDITFSNFDAASEGTSLADKDGTAGSFNFTVSLSKGSVTKKTTSKQSTIEATPYRKSNEVEVKPNTPSTSVDGLDDLTEAQTDAGTVHVEIIVAGKTTEDVETEAIENASTQKNIDFLDIFIEKDVNGLKSFITDTGAIVMELAIDYDLANKNNLGIYRYHDNAVDTFVESNTKEDGTFIVDKENNKIYLYATKFSTYAITYDTVTDESGTGTGGNDTSNPQTGDNSNAWLFIVLAVLSLGGIGFTVFKRKMAK